MLYINFDLTVIYFIFKSVWVSSGTENPVKGASSRLTEGFGPLNGGAGPECNESILYTMEFF